MSNATDKQKREMQKLSQMADEDIDVTDAPEVDDFTGAVRGRFYRPIKRQVTLRLDADLLAWFRSLGGEYQTRINSALREYMNDHRKAG